MQERDLYSGLTNPFTIQNVQAFREVAYASSKIIHSVCVT